MNYSKVLSKIKPPEQERTKIFETASNVISKLNLKGAQPMLGGSIAKGTWLSGNNDIDVYVRFNKESAEKDISKLLENALKNFKGVKRVHGSRDYFQIDNNGLIVELIPILKIDSPEEAKNITDISPLHVEWVTQALFKKSNLADDIRLAKSFLDAAGIYGAESYIHGFSGYSVEILIIHYGGFEKFLKAASKWKGKTIIDTANYYKGSPLEHLNESKIMGNLILIDPVQKERNAASSVSFESFELLVKAAKRYLSRPSLSFFEKKKVNLNQLKKNGYLVIYLTAIEGSDDVIGTKLYKCYHYFLQILHEFGIKDSGFDFNGKKALIWIKPVNKKLPKKKRHYGPPENVKYALSDFIKKWGGKNVKIEKGRSYVMVDRKFTDAKKLIQHEINDVYIKDRSKSGELI